MAEMHDTTEEYLETIFEIEEEGIVPIRARLVERLRLSAPSVSETVNRLVEQGNVELLDDRRLRLTPKGRAIARSIVRRHRLAERLLVDVIGLEWEKAHREADRWEHAISAEVEEKLVALLGDPATCPHGNPIPGSARSVDRSGSVVLSDAGPGAVVVSRISERLELDDDALTLIARARLTPGAEATVLGRDALGNVRLTTEVGDQVVPAAVARLMEVVPGAGEPLAVATVPVAASRRA
ncbi:MAG: DtxR family transcriptional regulator, Mn-dependent transcriptional regulator [Actinomycetota bacterium]|nr:DtxR family transcriptional regulator, Mn-dependent transcriptional regulator [Actinomycetota bacterium]